jgi:hypothetical protein
LRHSIDKLRAELASEGDLWHREILQPDDTVPEFASEIRALIVSEARELEEILRKKEMLQRLLEGLDETEQFVTTELNNQIRSFAAEEGPAQQQKGENRVIYRPKNES